MYRIVRCKLPDEYSGGEASLADLSVAERLHDGPLQDLVALQLKVAALMRQNTTAAEDRLQHMVELGTLAQAAIDHLHEIIRCLSTAAPKHFDLFARLNELGEEFRAGSGIACELRLEREHTRLAADVGDVVHRTIRELLTNVRKHAQATSVTVASRYRRDGAVEISVVDNGIGLPAVSRVANPFEGGGFGLWSIHHRLSAFDAFLEITGESGVCASVVLPRRLLTPG
jgi:signal transduction histidine kinase